MPLVAGTGVIYFGGEVQTGKFALCGGNGLKEFLARHGEFELTGGVLGISNQSKSRALKRASLRTWAALERDASTLDNAADKLS